MLVTAHAQACLNSSNKHRFEVLPTAEQQPAVAVGDCVFENGERDDTKYPEDFGRIGRGPVCAIDAFIRRRRRPSLDEVHGKMNVDMKKGMESDPTKAWAKMMFAHHQGAIEMSQTVLKETKDPLIREMAEKAIKDQTKEQTMLREWISKHGG